jgi:hypothetical protein
LEIGTGEYLLVVDEFKLMDQSHVEIVHLVFDHYEVVVAEMFADEVVVGQCVFQYDAGCFYTGG